MERHEFGVYDRVYAATFTKSVAPNLSSQLHDVYFAFAKVPEETFAEGDLVSSIGGLEYFSLVGTKPIACDTPRTSGGSASLATGRTRYYIQLPATLVPTET